MATYKGEIPYFYKQTCIIYPIYKCGNRADTIYYRPISLTSVIIKIYERYLRDVVVEFTERNSLLCNSQHGFVSGKSCLTQWSTGGRILVEDHFLAGVGPGVLFLAGAEDFLSEFIKIC